jgi:hypothetical protein
VKTIFADIYKLDPERREATSRQVVYEDDRRVILAS